MKNLTTNLMLAAIALTVAAGMASAQQLRAEIPFSFWAQGAMAPAGTYTVTESNSSGMPLFVLKNVATAKGLLLSNATSGDPKKAWEASGAAVLESECGDSGCALNRLWSNRGYSAYTFHHRTPGKGESTHLAVIRLAAGNTN